MMVHTLPMKLAPAVLLAVLGSAGPAAEGERRIECRVIQETPDGLYVDAGREEGIQPGDTGSVERGGVEIARVEVVRLSGNSALLRIAASRGPEGPKPGDRVILEAASPEGKDEGKSRPGGSASASTDEEAFIPLLTPQVRPATTAGISNIFHGRLRLEELYQIGGKETQDFSISKIGTDGGVERLGGTPWTFEWSGNVSYRAGEGLQNSEDFEKVRLDVFRLDLFRRFQRGGFLRAGRFIPQELPGVGYLDGVQDEVVAGDHLRLGGILGFRPDRRDLEPTAREPTAVAYGTVQAGKRGALYYSGTLGVLGSFYEGKPDRLALLLDQKADLGPKLSLLSTTEMDFDVSFETRSDIRLTRQDLYAVSPLNSFLTLRAGLDHFERPDIQAERDLLPFEDSRFFDGGYWRYWIGGSENLPWNLRLDEEIAIIDGTNSGDLPLWRAGLTRTGLPLIPAGQVSLTAYNLDGSIGEGYGFLLSAFLPVLEGRLTFRPAGGFRWVETAEQGEEFQIATISLYADWWISKTFSFYAGVQYSSGDYATSTLINMGLSFRF